MAPGPEGRAVKLASYNTHGGVGSDGRYRPERILAVLAELGADVIALQEVHHTPEHRRLLESFRRERGYGLVLGPNWMHRDAEYGNALLSRPPVLAVRRLDLSEPRREPRGAIDALLGVDGRCLRVVATHLGLAPGERRRQVRRLLDILAPGGACPEVLMGDMNEWLAAGRPLRWLERGFPPTRALPTFPARWPLLALDRIWVRPGRHLDGLAVHRTPLARLASDHLPITARLELGAH